MRQLMPEASNISIVPHGLIPVKDKYLYITKRIDRNNNKKLPKEDFCQLSEKLTEYKYDSSYEYCFKKALHYSSQLKLDTIKFFNIVLFSYLVGNTDMHLNNFYLINYGNGYVLSSCYDLICSEIIVNKKKRLFH